MDGREQETMEEDKESGSEESGSEDTWPEESSWEDKEDDELEEALLDAAGVGDTDRVKHLLAEGVNPNAVDSFLQCTPLHMSAQNGHHETVSALLTAGADVNSRDVSENTPLHYAATYGHPECAEIQLQYGADTGLRNKDGQTAEDIAAYDEDTSD
ncbi:PREDICTED: ankyrin repeat domain-containing protein 2A-like, partial [Branchiostoma belcheri]|uniref:Ankyrin repeat domain-containing protein 2A-like n=1 Tax=Branchiostoma belcheri TaxID=7741 RepID=A0A6P4XDB5_BRABE